jgi:Rhodopirellula transposase DDE domain
MVVMPSPFCDQAVDGTRRRAGGQHCNGSGATGSYQVTVARWRCPWRPQRESTGLATRHNVSGTTGQTLATTTTARSLQWNKIEHRLFSHITFNWRGRPLTSHEVVVKTIASTTTRSGLRVEAALDTGDYPTGIAISKQRFDALPLQRHATQSAWNYTLHPHPAATATQPEPVGEQDGSARRRQAMLGRLADSRLTGITSTDLQQLAAVLAPAQAARTQQRHAEQRGGRARRAAGKLRGRPLFDDAARLLLTLVYQRQVCSMTVLADLLEVTETCIGSLVHETREALEDHTHNHGIAAVRFATAHDLLAFLDQDLRPARTAIIHTLSDPTLTGMSRQELHQLTQRLTPRRAAHAERRTHQRRGGPRQPGTRRGVFPQKISNSERVLLTVLHLRRLCTLDVLADALGDVCRSAIGNAVRDTRPLLEQDGPIPPPAPIRYRTATELLTAATASRDTPTT